MTPDRLMLELLAEIAGKPDPAKYVADKLEDAGPAANQVVGSAREVGSDGKVHEFEFLANGKRKRKKKS